MVGHCHVCTHSHGPSCLLSVKPYTVPEHSTPPCVPPRHGGCSAASPWRGPVSVMSMWARTAPGLQENPAAGRRQEIRESEPPSCVCTGLNSGPQNARAPRTSERRPLGTRVITYVEMGSACRRAHPNDRDMWTQRHWNRTHGGWRGGG